MIQPRLANLYTRFECIIEVSVRLSTSEYITAKIWPQMSLLETETVLQKKESF